MSLDALNAVWKHSAHTEKELLCMLAIADHADQDGCAFPSYEHIAAKVRISKRTAQRIVAKLLEGDELEMSRSGRWGNSNVYTIRFKELCAKPAHFGTRTNDDSQVDSNPSITQMDTQVDNSGGQQPVHGTVSPEPSDIEPTTSAAGTLFDAPQQPKPQKPKPQKPDDSEIIQELWDSYVEVFGTDHLAIKGLTDARTRYLRSGLKATNGDPAPLKRAFIGLKAYRAAGRGHGTDISLDAVLKWRPDSNQSLTEQIEFWARQAGTDGTSDRHDIPSVLRARITERRVQVVEMMRHPDPGEGLRQRGEEAMNWLRQEAQEEPIVGDDGRITFRRIDS